MERRSQLLGRGGRRRDAHRIQRDPLKSLLIGFLHDLFFFTPIHRLLKRAYNRAKEIAATTFDAVAPLADPHREHRERMFALLGADEIDRGALEELRAAELALAEQASRAFVSALADLAETLTPEQRAELLEHRHERGHGWRRHRGW